MRPYRHRDHPRPTTRRQFLAQGFISGAALVMGPSLMNLFGRPSEAFAQAAANCNVGVGGAGKIPFLCFDLGGGASTAGSNVLVGGAGGQLDLLSDEGYSRMGLPADMTPRADPALVNTELGLAFHANSAFLRGIQSKTSTTTRERVNGAIFCARSDNDTGNNPHNPMYGIHKAGADGNLVTLIGTRSSDSGGRSAVPAAMFDPTVRPTKIDRPSDATGLVDTGKLIELLDPDDAAAVMLAVQNISDRKIERMNESALVESLMRSAYDETTTLVRCFGDPNALDPSLDPMIVAGAPPIFTAAELGQSEFRKTASVMKLVVGPFAGAGTIEFGGYDYHDSTRATGERKDFTAGQAMGAALEYAARVGVPLAIYVLSDGSVASDGTLDNSPDGGGKGIWKGDNSSTAGTFMLVFDPAGRPAMNGPTANQIGYFRPSGSVETGANAIASNVELLAQAIVLNYLALHGEVGNLGAVLPGHGLGSALDPLIAFASLPAFSGP